MKIINIFINNKIVNLFQNHDCFFLRILHPYYFFRISDIQRFNYNSFRLDKGMNTLQTIQKNQLKDQISILIVTQLEKQQSLFYCKYIIDMLLADNSFVIYAQDNSKLPNTQLYEKKDNKKIDYIISVGENITMMNALRFQSNFYRQFMNQNRQKNKQSVIQYTPPILSISDGDQPILSSYSNCQIDLIAQKFIQGAKKKQLLTKQVMRLDVLDRTRKSQSSFCCQLEFHRDMKKSVLKLKIFAKFQQGKQFYHLVNLWGDGLIISTPLGSMGRNINLSGPILYKSVQALIIVPISPLSLNFRPIILPANAQVLVEVEQTSRSSALMFMDRQKHGNLDPGNQIIIKRSQRNAQLIKGLSEKTTGQLWINCLREVLLWGQSYQDYEKKQKSSDSLLNSSNYK